MDSHTIRIHLASGSKIDIPIETDEEPEELASALGEDITEVKAPHWHIIDSVLIFTGAVSAIEVL